MYRIAVNRNDSILLIGDCVSYVIRGTVTETDTPEEVTTRYGTRSVATVKLQDEAGDNNSVTLWGDWAETASLVDPGMELLITELKQQTGKENKYATTGDSYVIVEPDFLVDVTDIREWVQCPRQYYLSKLDSARQSEPLLIGTLVHEVFEDLLHGQDRADAITKRINAASLDIGLLGMDQETVRAKVAGHAEAIDQWLAQTTLSGTDSWRSEQLLVSDMFGMKGRADAVRRDMPVELKTGKNTQKEPRFQDKIQAACYALMLTERGLEVDTGILLYTKNAVVDRTDVSGDLSPAKEFSIRKGLLDFAVRARNEIAAMEYDIEVPTGYEGDADCDRCFVQDTCLVVSGRLDQESKAGAIGTAIPEQHRQYFDTTYDAIEKERRAIHREYRKLWEQTPEERLADDRALINLTVVNSNQYPDGRWEITAKNPATSVGKFQQGDLVLASDGDPVHGEGELATLEKVSTDHLTISVDEFIELSRIDVYPSEITVDRMLTALHDALLRGSKRKRRILMGEETPAFDAVSEEIIPNNSAQNTAIQRALGANDCLLIHGPPGTGKTYTIAKLIKELVEDNNRVLLSAFTNRAVDNAIEQLREIGFADIIRVGSATGVREDMMDLRLQQSGDPQKQAKKLETASVVAATAASCGSTVLREQSFDVAVIDEASQLTEPETLAPINLADRFILVGDHHQLPPVTQVETEGTNDTKSPFKGDLSKSLFERMLDTYPDASVMLTQQYRMAQRIQSFASREFYNGKLRPATAEVARQSLSGLPTVDQEKLPSEFQGQVNFIDIPGDDRQRTDHKEADHIATLVERAVSAGIKPEDIGVIAPYRAQVSVLSERLPEQVAVDTVDRFQGSSKELILMSLVATKSLDGPIFEDHRRVNVALTRAKRGLILVGDKRALSSDPFYARMIEWAEH